MVEQSKLPNCLVQIWKDLMIYSQFHCVSCPYFTKNNLDPCMIPQLLKDHEELQVILRKKKEGNYESDSK